MVIAGVTSSMRALSLAAAASISCAAAFRAGVPVHSRNMRSSVLHMSTYATFKTSKDDFKAELMMDKLPITCSNFADLANTVRLTFLFIAPFS